MPVAAVRWLAREWLGDGPLDLAGLLVVVSTRQAGRRLRAALAEWAASRGQAVFPPRVVTPESLLELDPKVGAATSLETLLAWAQVFSAADLDEFRAVFPLDPPARSFRWAWRLARDFQRLQVTLAEGGLTLADVAARLPLGFAERARWECLAELSRRHASELARVGRREPQACRVAAADSPVLPAGIERVILLAVPDPLPLAVRALQRLAARVPVDVAVAAPPEEAANFDPWGRPVAAAWSQRDAPWRHFAGEVHLLADASAQAGFLAELAARYPEPDGSLGVALADGAIAPLVENALLRVRRRAFNPAGEAQRLHGFGQFLARLADFVGEASLAPTIALARTPEMLAWLAHEFGAGFSAARWLKTLDDLHCAHLPATLAELHACAGDTARTASREQEQRDAALAKRALGRLIEWRAELRRGAFAEATASALARVFGGRRLDLERAEDRAFAEAAEAWNDVVRECAAAALAFPGFDRQAWWEVARERFGALPRDTEKPVGAIELQGWLELPWEDAPHVVIAGFNEGLVPEAITGDVFLPESLRVQLGLKTNAERFARDAYLLHALVASRRPVGRVDVLVGKHSSAGDPLRPSRLLLQCAAEQLPERVRHLFRPLEAGAPLPAWERLWPLRPRRVAPPERLSPTAFRSYLECPFRFYLRHVLKMEAVDPAKCELDAFDFGTLCHAPLERFSEPTWRDCTDERVLAAMLVEEFDRGAHARFGASSAVPVVAQLESARQRLRRAAAVQARERAAGWVTQETERAFKIELGGLVISGKIDRIDRHEHTGEWRVLDYKTSDTPKYPVDAHLGRAREDAPEWMTVAGPNGRPRAWIDLQLPLYVHALPQLVPAAAGTRPHCAYFNLPKAVSATAVAPWEEFTIELQESALRCAEAVIAAVRAERFWPPNEEVNPEFDAFAELFQRGVKDSVEWPGEGGNASAQVREVSS